MRSPDYSKKAWTRRSGRGKTIHERFDEKVDKAGECWVWRGAKTSRGYGVLRIDGKNVYVHRLALEFDGRPVGSEQLACHHCDNPPCVRPSHLYVGTSSDNVHDALDRGRAVHHRPDPVKSSERWRRYWAEHMDSHPQRMKTHCPQGHEYTPENIYWDKTHRKRHCRLCANAQSRAAYWRRKTA